MPIEVEGPDGAVLEFPDGTSRDEMRQAMARRYRGNRPRSSNPTGRRPNAQTATPLTQRQNEALQARAQRQPQGRPGTPLRALEDFNREGLGGVVSQAWRQVPFSDEAARLFGGEGAADYQRQERERVAREQPGVNAAATAMNIVGLAGTPTAALPRIGMLQGGAAAAGVNAPFALARQEGSLEERIPGALQETAVVGGLGAGLTGIGNALGRQAPRSGQVVANMQRLGVPENAATASTNPLTRSLTQLAAQNLITGPRVRGALTRSLEGTRDAATRTAAGYGRAVDREAAGEGVRNALNRFSRDASIPNPAGAGANPWSVSTREWSAAAKANAVFDHALSPIAGNPAQLTTTQATLRSILSRADDPAVATFREDPVLRQFIGTIEQVQAPTLRDLRELRRGIREAQNRPSLDGQTVDNAALQRLEAALTQDMYASAGASAADLRRADAFYRTQRERIESALRAIGGDDPTLAGSRVYNAVLQAASRDRGNTRALQNLRRALRDDEWRTFTASVIDHMGVPTAGASGVATDIGFSVHQFARAYRDMSPAARRILFGSVGQGSGRVQATRALAQDLDDLAEIALRQKGIENMTTPSGRDVQNAIMGGLAVYKLPAAAAVVLTLGISGEMLTNPAFVRWLTSQARSGGQAGGARASLQALANIAARDPAIVPYFEAYRDRIEAGQSPAPARQLEASASQ